MYSLLDNGEELELETRFGKPSDSIAIGELAGRKVAFLPRHGSKHTIPPHKVPYRANIEAMSQLGVERIISESAVGSLRASFMPGDFVFPDQFINLSHGRDETFFDGGSEPVTHVSTAKPYCDEMRQFAITAGDATNVKYHNAGTVIVISGPRFSTKAESKFFRSIGGDIVNMTQYPEIALARERGMCFLGISVITDYDSGVEENRDIGPVSFNDVGARMNASMGKMKALITEIVRTLPEKRSCSCKDALADAAVKA